MSPTEQDALFRHADDTAEIDRFPDPVRDIAARLHEAGPVIRGQGLDLAEGSAVQFAGITFPNILIAAHYTQRPTFAAVSWDAARAVYLNPALFSSSLFRETFGAFWGPSLAPLDPPEHTAFRILMQRGFVPGLVKSWDDTIIRPVLARRFDAIKGKGRADLLREINAFYPYEIFASVVGVDPQDIAFVASCFSRILQSNSDPGEALEASRSLKAYSAALIEERRRSPKNDLISAMADAEVDGAPIPEENFVAMVNHLMAGGIDTTAKQSGNTVSLLLDHPDQFDLIKADRSLIPRAVEEALRYEGVGGIIARLALEDTDLCGTPIPKGSVVWLMHGVINRDPARWENPDRFDIRRESIAHMQFSNGPHSCIGQHLARVALARYVERLIDDLPNLRWDPELDQPPKITGWTARGPLRLPVVWNASGDAR